MQCLLVPSVVLLALVEAKPYRNRLGYPSGMGRRNGLNLGSNLGNAMVFENGPSGTGMGFENGMETSGMGFENGMDTSGMGFENGMGLGNGMGLENGIGFENGMGYETGRGGLGLGRGYGSQFANGQEFGSKRFNKGASGFGNQGIRKAGGKRYHNIGAHHRKISSNYQAEDDESHNIGADSAFESSAQAGRGFKNYQNGASQYGNQFNQGAESSFL